VWGVERTKQRQLSPKSQLLQVTAENSPVTKHTRICTALDRAVSTNSEISKFSQILNSTQFIAALLKLKAQAKSI